MSKIVILKTIAGEELLATENESLSGGTYSKIRIFQMSQQGAGLIPWILLSPDAEVNIRRETLVCDPIPAPFEIEKQYLSATSGIALA